MATQMHQMLLSLKSDRKRLSDQCSVILGRFQSGRVSNKELSAIALNYTARISTLRKKGLDIRKVFHNRTTGLVQYALFVNGHEWDHL